MNETVIDQLRMIPSEFSYLRDDLIIMFQTLIATDEWGSDFDKDRRQSMANSYRQIHQILETLHLLDERE